MNIIKKLRLSKGLKQYDLAIELEICKDYLSLIERSKRTPGFKLACKIANYFDVTIESLNFFDDTKNKMFDNKI